ncbi:LuxR C-terminal-related transcriptional regulator [Streptomyces sp. S.PB5]|uniref:ATP-binding protein n=1 Tax=Streptomyces sp. S.PB5 TaxID=3020844 RepID=UPI0025B0B93D|nr:LuxR C-terminal-related transcriptional regulator [Streptomyces sp. S.PB5]MDN3021757.1 LuxR C-terminal-related transcriptional regulator [Streptomyces sp. S.PB5]
MGRRQEVAEVKRLSAGHRLVTLTGVGGVGKTRLALHAVPGLARAFGDGAHVVQLVGVRDASLVPLAVIEALNILDASGRSPLQALVDHVRDRELLLVLDNCEHLADACAELTATLLAESARLRVLATSRHRLAVDSEHVLEVQPLATPSPGERLPANAALEYPALALFADRAAAVLPGFALTADNQDAVAALCRRLDGLPLAIELAAARLRVLGIRQLLERLDRRYRLLAEDGDDDRAGDRGRDRAGDRAEGHAGDRAEGRSGDRAADGAGAHARDRAGQHPRGRAKDRTEQQHPRHRAPSHPGDRPPGLPATDHLLPRHRTLRAAVDWSHELCTPQEQTLWARASVFPGTFDVDAVEEVCAGPDLDRDELVDALTGLVDKSLLVRDGDAVHARYRMLESIRQYGLDRLRETGEGAEDAARQRVREWCVRFAEECERRWFGPDQPELVRRLHAELDTVRSALEFCLDTPGEAQTGLRLAGHLWFFWFACGTWVEGRYWYERLLAAAPEPTRARARALWGLALMLLVQADAARAEPLAEESYELSLRLADGTEAAHTFLTRGGSALIRGDFERAREVYEQALSRPPRENELMSLVGFKHVELAFVLTIQGEYDRATALCEEFRQTCLAAGERWVHSYLLRILAFTEWSKGDRARARTHARECLRLKRVVGDVLGIAMTLELLAAVHAGDGEGRPAAVLLGAADRIWRHTRSTTTRNQSHGPVRRAAEERARQLLGDGGFGSAHREGLELSFDQAADYALGKRATPRRLGLDIRLTRREAEVAELIAQGLTNQQIADRLVVARRTAEGHVERILSKLGLTSRSQVALWAVGRQDAGHGHRTQEAET